MVFVSVFEVLLGLL